MLDVIENEKLKENAKLVGDYMLDELEKIKLSCDLIGDVRGKGKKLDVIFVFELIST